MLTPKRLAAKEAKVLAKLLPLVRVRKRDS